MVKAQEFAAVFSQPPRKHPKPDLAGPLGEGAVSWITHAYLAMPSV